MSNWLAVIFCLVVSALCPAVHCVQQNKLQMLVTLRLYSASDNDFYKCGAQTGSVNYGLCGYRLQVEAFSDGIALGYLLFDKQVYTEEITFQLRQDDGYQNPVKFQLTEYPGQNVSVRLVLHYYSASERKINRVFRSDIYRLPQVSRELFEDAEDVTIPGDGHSSLSISIKFRCNANYFGSFCAVRCLPPDAAQYCTSDGQLLCQRTAAPPPCEPTTQASVIAKPTPAIIEEIPTTTTTTTATATTTTLTAAEKRPATTTATAAAAAAEKPAAPEETSTQPQTIWKPNPTIVLIMCAVILLALLLAVALAVGLAVRCARAGKSQDTPTSANGHSQANDIWRARQQQPQFNTELVHFENGTYRNIGRHPGVTVVQELPPPPPAPLEAYCLQHHRGSCSGSSCICSASTFNAGGGGGYEQLRHPDGEEQPQLPPTTFVVNGNGTLPFIRPPTEFATNTVRSSSHSRVGGNRNVLAAKSFEC